MVAVTYDTARVAARQAVKAARAEAAAPRKPWYVRFMDALVEARAAQARREVERYLRMMPHRLDEHGNRLVKVGKSEMPFGGW